MEKFSVHAEKFSVYTERFSIYTEKPSVEFFPHRCCSQFGNRNRLGISRKICFSSVQSVVLQRESSQVIFLSQLNSAVLHSFFIRSHLLNG